MTASERIRQARQRTQTTSELRESTIDEATRHSIAELVAYSWADEERDYCENPDDRHVFTHIERIQSWLEATA